MSNKSVTDSWDASTVLMVVVLSVGLGVAACLTLGLHLWAALNGQVIESWNPITLTVELVSGQLVVPREAWFFVAGVVGVLAVVALGVAALFGRKNRARKRGDKASGLTGLSQDISGITAASAKAKAQRLGVLDTFGFPIARTVKGMILLTSSVEDVTINISGPRTGKTTSWVVPRIIAAVGAVVATSNKRDIVDATRYVRADSTKERVWVFDPQAIVGEPQTWFWNPLSYVTDSISALSLANIFIDATRDANAKTDAFWSDAARDHVAGLLLAAARGNYPLTRLHTWLTDVNDSEPVALLKNHGDLLMAQTVQGNLELVQETRDGIMKNATQMMSFLLNERAITWATPKPGLEEFKPADFVASKQTLYCMSQEGRGSAAPIVTALTVAVTEAAVEYAKNQKGGRLSSPMLVALDEAANVCRWRELPDMYSHFGSRGITVDTVLQSWSQGVSVWGEPGMKKLWSAANIKVYGGGVSEREFLSTLSDLIGDHYLDGVQISTSNTGRSVSTSKNSVQRRIATVADLGALPAGRMWVFGSGATPVLCEAMPWYTGKLKSAVEASIKKSEGALA